MRTGAPAALALALGFQDLTNGVAAKPTPTAPTADVAPTKKYRRFLFGSSPLNCFSLSIPVIAKHFTTCDQFTSD
tara:strand:- start:10 stop:234 length:225 start_codon:yes stop_codon:yes gene_type:complete